MKHSFYRILFVITVMTTLLAACAAPGSESTTPEPTIPSTEAPSNSGEKPEVVFEEGDPLGAIKRFLYENYGVHPEDVTLIEQSEREWSDSCLGLGGPAESCLQVITPGFLVIVETPQGKFSFRTTDSLEQFRMDNTFTGELPERFNGMARFQWLLAGRLDIPFEQVAIVSREPVEWPNACLGVQEPEMMCAEVITPGYKITLSTPVGNVVIHTDAELRNYRSPEPLPGEDRPILIWERSGGIAGICERMTVSFDGAYVIDNCRGENLYEGVMDTAAYEELIALAVNYGLTKWTFQPPAGSADMFIDAFTFNGRGSETATAIQQESMNLTFSSLAEYLKTLPVSKI